MSNIFIRTSIAPYRVDTYNALHTKLGMKMCFYHREDKSQKFDVAALESQCAFEPVYLKGLSLGSVNRKLCFGIWRLLRREKPQVVIVPEFQLSALQVLLYRRLTGRRFKVVGMVDDSYDMIANGNDFTRLHARLRSWFPKHYDDLILVTPEVEQWYQARFGKGIWMPIIMDDKRMEEYYASILDKSAALAEQYVLSGKKVLLAVNRLVELKNLHRVIEAYGKANEDSVLVIVGDGPERKALEDAAARIDKRVVFTGRFDGDELYAWYNLASAFILASYQEAFGAVTNEALLAGCRVVVSRNAGSSCLVDGSNGELIDSMDTDGIAAAIDRQLALAAVPDLKTARKSLMSVSFGERISNLVDKLSA